MDKKAKILATLGPSIFKKNIINQLIRSGVDGFRINFSHNLSGIEKIVKIIRDCEKLNAKPIAIVADLQGIKLRIGKILENQVSLKRGDTFNFDLMRFSEIIKTAFLAHAATLTTHPITHFEADRAIQNYKGPVLWVHDAEDKVCPYKDLINFQEKATKNINFLITKGLGHNKVYKTQAVIDKIVAFLAPED